MTSPNDAINDTAFADAIERLARYNRRNTMMLRRMRNLYLAFFLIAALSSGSIVYGAIANATRISEIQQVRRAAIIYSCREQNHAHLRTLIFLDATQLQLRHMHVGPRRWPAIEHRALRALHHLPPASRRTALSNHRLLLGLIANLVPYRHCAARARALSSGQTHP